MKLRLIGNHFLMTGALITGTLLTGASLAGPLLAQDQPPEVIYLFADLSGANVTGGGDEDGYGDFAASVKLTENQFCYELSAGEIGAPTAAHIHVGEAGVDGGPVITLTALSGGGETCVAADGKLLKKIANQPGDYYVNVHTADFPAGAIRGQLQA